MSATVTRTFPILGMACSACSANVERTLSKLQGMKHVSVSLPGRTALVEYDPDVLTPEKMKLAVAQAGYDMVVEENRSVETLERQAYVQLRRRMILAWVFAALIMSVTMGWIPISGDAANGVSETSVRNQSSLLLCAASLILCGRQFYVSAWRQLLHLTANMDTLVALSTGIAFLFSTYATFCGASMWGDHGITWHTYFDAPAMIVAFVLTGRVIEEHARDGMAESIRRLMGLQPRMARVVKGEHVNEVPIAAIAVGDVLEVRAGEKIPVDGEVEEAESFMTADAAYVDESMISGEPTPVGKRHGSTVLAGTILEQGKLRFRAQMVGEQTALASIIRTVQQAQASKAPVQRIVDKASRVFVPVVGALAAVTFLAWWCWGGSQAFSQAVLSAVAVLVVACPCAMGLATPTALMVGIGKAAERNILIKDASALENIRKVNVLVMDKTGTLTVPNPQVDFTRADGLSLTEREALRPHAPEAIERLHREGVEIHLMSGDREDAVAYWAKQAGIQHWHSGARPQDKEDLVRRLQREGKRVAMVGDGINDTQALACADVSVAMGKGTDVAMNVAQVTLLGEDLRRLPDAVSLSRRTVHMIWQNLFWAFIYNLVCIPLAAGVPYLFGLHFQLSPMWASLLMALSSVSVVLNSLRLKFAK